MDRRLLSADLEVLSLCPGQDESSRLEARSARISRLWSQYGRCTSRDESGLLTLGDESPASGTMCSATHAKAVADGSSIESHVWPAAARHAIDSHIAFHTARAG